METNRSNLLNAEQSNLYAVLFNIIGSKNIINVGIISTVIDENTVTVSLYNSDNQGNPYVITNVHLLHEGTSKCRSIIKPAIGDLVLLFGNRDYLSSLEYNHKPADVEVYAPAFSNTNMLGILISPDETDNDITEVNIDEKGNINTWTNGNVTVTIKQDDEVKVSLSATADGTIDISASDTVTLDGDSYGGLCKTQELKTQLDKVTARIDGIINAIKNGKTASQDGGAVLLASFIAGLASITDKEDFSNIESETVMHGEGE